MDPASIIGLISALTQLVAYTAKVATSLSDYCSTVKNAPARSKELCDELETVSAVLHSLTQLLKPDSNVQISLLPISALQKTAQKFGELLQSLERRVQPLSFQGHKKYFWPLSKSRIEKALVKLERHKITFSLALNVQNMYRMPSSCLDIIGKL